jgi:sterol 3beta-glucosyltransferase
VNVLILTLDTRGDVQPFVALPRGLANAGHEAVLAAPHRFEGFVGDQGVPFAGIDDCWSVAAEGPGAGADILVHNGQVVVGQHVAEKLGIPAVLALPIPMYVPTREFPWAGMAIPRWWPLALNRATFLGVKGPGDDVRPHRRQVTLDLPRRRGRHDPSRRLSGAGAARDQPTCAATAADWPDAATVTGCWFLADTERGQSPLPAP